MDPELLTKIGGYQLLLPLLHFVAAWIISRLFRLPFWFCVLGGTVPAALVYLEFPFTSAFRAENPLALVIGGWVLLVVLALVRLIAVGLIRMLSISSGTVGTLFSVLLMICLGVSTILLVQPNWVRGIAPSWESGFVFFLFGIAFVGLAVACFRFLRVGIVIVLWAFGVFVLGSEAFLGSIPNNYLSEKLRVSSSFIPESVMGKFVDSLEDLESEGKSSENLPSQESVTRIAIFGDEDWVGSPSVVGPTYPEQLEVLLNARSTKGVFQVQSVTSKQVGMLQIRDEVRSRLQGNIPDVVVVGGWSTDSKKGVNAFGLSGLGEFEALSLVQDRKWVAQIPLVSSILDSKFVRLFFDPADIGLNSGSENASARLSPDEYSKVLSEIISAVEAAGSQAVLLYQPTLKQNEKSIEYRRAMLEAAKGSHALVVDPSAKFRRFSAGSLFVNPTELSVKGHRLVADEIYNALSERSGMAVSKGSQGQSTKVAKLTRPYEEIASVSDTRGDLIFDVQVDPEQTGYYRVFFTANDRIVGSKRLNVKDLARLRFRVPESDRIWPFVKLGLMATEDLGSDSKEITPPYWITVKSSPNQIGGELQILSDQFSLTKMETSKSDAVMLVLDYNSGEIVRRSKFVWRASDAKEGAQKDGISELSAAIRSVPWGQIVVVSTKSLPVNYDREGFGASLHYLGIESTPAEGERAVLIGTAGRNLTPVFSFGSGSQKVDVIPPRKIALQVASRELVKPEVSSKLNPIQEEDTAEDSENT